METIWNYLESLGYTVTPRPSDKTVHLALECEKMNGAQKKRMPERYHVTEKLDGVYALVTVIYRNSNTPEVRHWGRSGKAMSNCEELDKKVAEQLTRKDPFSKHSFILISEITSDNHLAELSGYLTPSRVNEATVIPENLRDNFHDLIGMPSFILGNSSANYMRRRSTLEYNLDGTELHLVPQLGFMELHEAIKYAQDEIYPQGKEGLICRANTPWIAGKRDETVVKIKEKLSFDVTVVGMCSGKEGSKYENTLGKLAVVFSAHGNKRMNVVFEVPISGMKDSDRRLWWEHPELIIGATVKMDAKSYTATGNLREPRYKEVRMDKEPDFPVTVSQTDMSTFTKGKAKWRMWYWEK